MQDLFNSVLSRNDLVDIYVDVHQVVRHSIPKDFAQMGRAALVAAIEQLDEESRHRARELFDLTV